MPTAGDHPPEAPISRPKRSQVARACDWCRLNRIKCDEHQPCRNCQLRGGECSNRRREHRTLPAANREIERLRLRIAELETKLREDGHEDGSPQPSRSDIQIIPTVSADSLEKNGSIPLHWKGFWAASSKTNQMLYYGPSSLRYFIHVLQSRFDEVTQQSGLDGELLPITASHLYTTPSGASKEDYIGMDSLQDYHISGKSLSRSQEEHFLNPFWQSYYCTLPILDSSEFQEHYKSLWISSTQYTLITRAPSALVDIVLALCMQYGAANAVKSNDGLNIDSADASIGGSRFYDRCQVLLLDQRERPTVFKVQCHIYSAVYLWNASFLDMALDSLAIAINSAHALGLDQSFVAEVDSAQRNLYQRIWCTLFILDTQYSMHLGRPFIIHRSEISFGPPIDTSGRRTTPEKDNVLSYDGINYLEYQDQCVKLISIARTIHEDFYEKCDKYFTESEGKSLYDDPRCLETSARVISDNYKRVDDWAQSVPKLLKNSGNGSERQFSTSSSVLETDLSAPLWLLRQRISLELLYHGISMCLYRHFVKSSSSSLYLIPTADSNGHRCFIHAIAITNLIHQVLTKTTILNGIYQMCDYQWQAGLVLVGFLFFRPVCPLASTTREATQKAIKNLEIIGTHNMKTAASAAKILRNLSEKLNLHVNGFQQTVGMPFLSHSHDSGSSQQSNFMIEQLVDPINAQPSMQMFHTERSTLDNLTTVLPPTTAKEFAARMKTGFKNHDTSWLNSQNFLDPGIEAWDDWME